MVSLRGGRGRPMWPLWFLMLLCRLLRCSALGSCVRLGQSVLRAISCSLWAVTSGPGLPGPEPWAVAIAHSCLGGDEAWMPRPAVPTGDLGHRPTDGWGLPVSPVSRGGRSHHSRCCVAPSKHGGRTGAQRREPGWPHQRWPRSPLPTCLTPLKVPGFRPASSAL